MAVGGRSLLQDPDWRRRNSMWLLPSVACCGLLTWVSFLYIGIAAKKRAWLVSSAAYGVAAVAFFVLLGTAPSGPPGEPSPPSWQSSVGTTVMLLLWLGGAIHGLVINRQWLAFLASSQESTAAALAASAPVAERMLGDPWRWFVAHAVAFQHEIRTAVATTPAGPMRDRLQVLAGHVDVGLAECRQLAQQGQRLTDARTRINTSAVAQKLSGLQALESSASLIQAKQSFQAQLDTAARIDRDVRSTYDGLVLMNARLGEVAARVTELSVRPHALNDVAAVESAVETVVLELVAIR